MTDNGPVTLVHQSPLGALWVNGVGEVEPGAPFQVPAELAATLLEQSDLYKTTKAPAKGDVE